MDIATGSVRTPSASDCALIERDCGVTFERGDAHLMALVSADGHVIAERRVSAARSLRGEATAEDRRWALAAHRDYSVDRVTVYGLDRATNAAITAHPAVVRRAASLLRAIERADGVRRGALHSIELRLVDRDGAVLWSLRGDVGGIDYATDRAAVQDRATAREYAARGAVELQLVLRDREGHELGEAAAPAGLRERVLRFRRRLAESSTR